MAVTPISDIGVTAIVGYVLDSTLEHASTVVSPGVTTLVGCVLDSTLSLPAQ